MRTYKPGSISEKKISLSPEMLKEERYKKAVRMHSKTLLELEKNPGSRPLDLIPCKLNLALTHFFMEKWDPSLTIFLGVLVDAERILGGLHPCSLAIRNHIAHILIRKGKSRAGVACYLQVIQASEQVLLGPHPRQVHTSKNILHAKLGIGIQLINNSRYDEALHWFSQMLQEQQDQQPFSEKSPDILAVRRCIAMTQYHRQEWREAAQIAQQVFYDLNQTRPNHRQTLHAKNLYVTCLQRSLSSYRPPI